jgi:ABC-type Mn2+/Zn2+ transport system permease subunit
MMATAVGVALAASACGLYLSFHADVAGGAAVTAALCGAFLLALVVRMPLARLRAAQA